MSNPVINSNGDKCWYNEFGHFHREDGPAFEGADGSTRWYLNGVVHRKDGPAVTWVERSEYRINGKLSRVGGPAVEWTNGDKEWFWHGLLHREDGPAVIYADGYIEFWVAGNRYSDLENYCMAAGIEGLAKTMFLLKYNMPQSAPPYDR